MTTEPHGQSGRQSQSALANLLASPAPDLIKARVPILLERLARYDRLDEAEIGRDQPELLQEIRDLTPVGVDFFRILRGETPQHRRYTRQHVSAALRHKRRTVLGSMSPSDFAEGHHVPLLADVYWGGVAAWALGAPSRAQEPKNHWRKRENQIKAVRDFASQHPNTSITLATLHDAGLHALANALTAEGLEKLAQEAGVSRNLKYRPDGSWTRTMVITSYIKLCESAQIPLSSHMLTKVGPEGFSVRALARTLFGSFEAFRCAVGAINPRLGPKARPTTKDGVLLDSHQEVLVYEYLRSRLSSEVSISPHVLLDPALPHRSVDFLLGGTVYVEVLMISQAEIDRPAGNTQQKYAAKWRCKSDWYEAGNKPLVIIEPDDVLNPDRMAVKAEQVLRLLNLVTRGDKGLDPNTPPAAVRHKNYWSFARLCRVIAEVAHELGHFPTHDELCGAGHSSAPTMLTRYGSRRVAEHIGVKLCHEKGVWDLDGVERELAAWVMSHGRYPSVADLKLTGHSRLASAWPRLGQGRMEEVRATVERICGRTLPRRRAAPGSYVNQEQLAAQLRPLCTSLGRFPRRVEMRAAGLPATVWALVSTRYGVRQMASFMGVPYKGPRRSRVRSSTGGPSPSPGTDLFSG